jgi:hypothetical protein
MNNDQTLETCDSGEPSRISLLSCGSGKFISDDSLRNALNTDSFPKLSAVLLLYSALVDRANELNNFLFKTVEKQSRENGFLLRKEKRKGLEIGKYRKRLVMQRVVRKMIFNGEMKLIQRPFWVWKMIMPEKKTLRAQSVLPDTGLVLRRLVNRIGNYLKINQISVFFDIQNYGKTYYCRTPEKRYKACLIALQKIIKRPMGRYFQDTADIKYKKLKNNIINLNAFFKRILINAFKNWQNYYPEICQEDGYEPLNQMSLQLKNFNVMKKPCVPYFFHDIHSYEPAFQATFHNLNHFMKRILKKSFKIWSKYRKISVNRKNSLKNSKINYSLFILNEFSSQKLQVVLSKLLLIHQKRSDMSKAFLSQWSENSTLKNLRLSRLKLIISSHSKKMNRKKLFFTSFQENQGKKVEFTDIYK